jgi:hypothetical protein
MPSASVVAAIAILNVLSACGASEPELPCGDLLGKMYDLARQIDREDAKVLDLSVDFSKLPELCAIAKANTERSNELRKLVKARKNRCEATGFELNMGAGEAPLSRAFVDQGACK